MEIVAGRYNAGVQILSYFCIRFRVHIMSHAVRSVCLLAIVGLIGCDTDDTIVTPSSLEPVSIEESTIDATHDADNDHGHEGGGHDHEHGDHDHDDHNHGDHDDGDHEHQHGHADHDHDSLTLADVMKTYQDQRSAIEAAFDKDSPGDAHDPMHQIGHTLGDFRVAARNQNLDEPQTSTLNEHVENLMDAFMAIDEGFHGGEETSYDDVREKIETATAGVQSVVDQVAIP